MTNNDKNLRVEGEILPYSHITFRQALILGMCFIIAMLDGFDILVIAFTAPAISAELKLASEQAGIVFSAGLFGMAFGAMALGFLADVFGRRIVICGTLGLAGVATFATGFITDITQLVALRFVAGVGLGTLLSALAPLIGEFSPKKQRNFIIAMAAAFLSIGGMVGGMLTAAIIGEAGWRAIFIYAGVITCIVAVLYYFVVPESMSFIAKRRPVTALQEINQILHKLGYSALAAVPLPPAEKAESATVVSLLAKSRRWQTLILWSAFFLAFATIYFINSWMPNILVSKGMTQEQGIHGTVILTFGAIVGSLLVAFLSRWIKLNRVIAGSFILGAVLLVLFSVLIDNLAAYPGSVLSIMLFAMGVCITGAFSNLTTVSVLMYPAHIRTTGLGWCNGIGRFGAVVSPTVSGFLIAYGVTMNHLFLFYLVPVCIAALCAWLIKLEPAASAEQLSNTAAPSRAA